MTARVQKSSIIARFRELDPRERWLRTTLDAIMETLFYFLTDLSSMGAYTVVFTMLIACGLGLPLPEDIPLVASGYLIWDQTFSPIPTLLVTMIGVLLFDFMALYRQMLRIVMHLMETCLAEEGTPSPFAGVIVISIKGLPLIAHHADTAQYHVQRKKAYNLQGVAGIPDSFPTAV